MQVVTAGVYERSGQQFWFCSRRKKTGTADISSAIIIEIIRAFQPQSRSTRHKDHHFARCWAGSNRRRHPRRPALPRSSGTQSGTLDEKLKHSRLPSSLSQFEEAIGHWRGRRCGDGEALVDCFQDKAAVEAPGECAEVARQMFGVDHAVRGQEAVLDVGQHRVRPAEGGVARGGAIGAGDMALVDDARLLGNAAKPLAAVADDGRSGLDTGA